METGLKEKMSVFFVTPTQSLEQSSFRAMQRLFLVSGRSIFVFISFTSMHWGHETHNETYINTFGGPAQEKLMHCVDKHLFCCRPTSKIVLVDSGFRNLCFSIL